MAIRAGKLNKRITIQAPGTAQDEYGAPIESWTDFAIVWASVEPLQGREFYASQQFQAEQTTRFRIRYLTGVKPTMRVVYAGRKFNISAIIDPDEEHEELHIMATEIKA